MAARRPALSAIWFLTTFGSGPSIDALGGDLAEEFQRGKSAAWLWRQSIAGVFVSFLYEVRAHPILAGRAVLVGLAALAALFMGVGALMAGLDGVAKQRLPLWFYMQWQVYSIVAAALTFVVAMLAGLTVATLHRRHRAMATLSVLAVLLLMAGLDAELYRLMGNALTHQRYLPYLLLHLLNVTAAFAGLIVGGFALARRDRPSRLPQ
jgi:hypothetical protein